MKYSTAACCMGCMHAVKNVLKGMFYYTIKNIHKLFCGQTVAYLVPTNSSVSTFKV